MKEFQYDYEFPFNAFGLMTNSVADIFDDSAVKCDCVLTSCNSIYNKQNG